MVPFELGYLLRHVRLRNILLLVDLLVTFGFLVIIPQLNVFLCLAYVLFTFRKHFSQRFEEWYHDKIEESRLVG